METTVLEKKKRGTPPQSLINMTKDIFIALLTRNSKGFWNSVPGTGMKTKYINNLFIKYITASDRSFRASVFDGLEHRWQTQVPKAESGPPPCFIWPSTLFLPGRSASSLPLFKEQLHLYSPKIKFSPLKANVRLMLSLVKMSLTPCFKVKAQFVSLIITIISCCCSY